MPNISGSAYALTTLCPIKKLNESEHCGLLYTRTILQDLKTGAPDSQKKEVSPFAGVPNTYLGRLFILDDAIFQNFPHSLDKLNSSYLVFTVNFYDELDAYLHGMYDAMKDKIFDIWKCCYGFEKVVAAEKTGNGSNAFVNYIKKCQMETTFFFNGSTDESLEEQLKSLYLKQEFSKFVFEHHGAPPAKIFSAFKEFLQHSKPESLSSPSWKAGVSHLDEIVK